MRRTEGLRHMRRPTGDFGLNGPGAGPTTGNPLQHGLNVPWLAEAPQPYVPQRHRSCSSVTVETTVLTATQNGSAKATQGLKVQDLQGAQSGSPNQLSRDPDVADESPTMDEFKNTQHAGYQPYRPLGWHGLMGSEEEGCTCPGEDVYDEHLDLYLSHFFKRLQAAVARSREPADDAVGGRLPRPPATNGSGIRGDGRLLLTQGRSS